jgi:hypothetical protein
MAFKQVQDLDSDVTISMGGVNKKTGKKNPTSAEGYYLGSRKVVSQMAKSGFAQLHFLQTEDGNLGVWGKTNLDQKLTSVTPGTMVRITQTGMQKIPGKRDMYKFTVEVDDENTIEVNLSAPSEALEETGEDVSDSGEEILDKDDTFEEDEEEAPLDEAPPARTKAPARAAQPPSKAAQAKVKGLLGNRKSA